MNFALKSPSYAPFWRATVMPALSALQTHWLLRPGALTDGLRQLGRLDLRVVREYACGAPPDEASALRQPARTPIWVREIVMRVDCLDAVAARSVTPLAASHGVWQGIRRLGSRPLADMLYHDAAIARSPFAVARLRAPLAFYWALRRSQMIAATPRPLGLLLARRSVFWRRHQPLIVAECFLPGFWRLAQHGIFIGSPEIPKA